ncbi:MAG: signal peptide peptidase SppA [Planctomycetes bacterium]|nr:signal peptide peptidase SppA [Planctomycetota bacterium]
MDVATRGFWVLLLSLMAAACGPLTFTVGGPGDQRLRQTVVVHEDGWGGERVAIIDVTGMLFNSSRQGLLHEGANPVAALQEKLEAARTDSRVRAVILRLNTPGGTVTASDAMYREVLRFKEQSHKPVVALMMDVTASGGYYLACSTDEIVAYPTSVTGSIGVIVQTLSVKQGLARIGVETEAFTSGPNKDVGSPLSNMTDDHRAVLRALVKDFYERFTEIVRTRRPNIPADQFARVTDGRVMSGDEAVKLGLADRAGDIYDAFETAKRRAGLKRAELVVVHRASQRVASVHEQGNASSGVGGVTTQINFAQINLPEALLDAPAGFYYMWSPEFSGAR